MCEDASINTSDSWERMAESCSIINHSMIYDYQVIVGDTNSSDDIGIQRTNSCGSGSEKYDCSMVLNDSVNAAVPDSSMTFVQTEIHVGDLSDNMYNHIIQASDFDTGSCIGHSNSKVTDSSINIYNNTMNIGDCTEDLCISELLNNSNTAVNETCLNIDDPSINISDIFDELNGTSMQIAESDNTICDSGISSSESGLFNDDPAININNFGIARNDKTGFENNATLSKYMDSNCSAVFDTLMYTFQNPFNSTEQRFEHEQLYSNINNQEELSSMQIHQANQSNTNLKLDTSKENLDEKVTDYSPNGLIDDGNEPQLVPTELDILGSNCKDEDTICMMSTWNDLPSEYPDTGSWTIPSTVDEIAQSSQECLPITPKKRKRKHIKVKKKATATSVKCKKLWQFLLDTLEDPHYNLSVIQWTNKKTGVFNISDHNKLAELWSKNRHAQVKYEFLARSLRHYYTKKILHKVGGKKLTYQFGDSAQWRQYMELKTTAP